MKRNICLVILLSMIFLVGCSSKNHFQVGNAVQEESYEGFTSEEIQNIVVSSDSVFENLQSVLDKEYPNFLMPNSITIDKSTLLSEIIFEQVSNFDKDVDSIFQILLDEYYSKDLKLESYDAINKGKIINNEELQVYAAVLDNGVVSFMKPEGYAIGFDDSYETIKTINVDRGDSLDLTYQLSNGTQSVQDAISYVEMWLDNTWNLFDTDFVFHVKTVKVRKVENHFFYEMIIEKWYEGIPLDDIMNTTDINIDENSNMLVKYITNDINLRVCSVDSIDVFANGNGIITASSKMSDDTGWIPLENCMDMLSVLFSDYSIYKITDIELKYIICPDYTSLDPSLERYNYKFQGIEMKSYPIWRFLVEIPDESVKKNENGNLNNPIYHIDVNMRTGEVWFELDDKETQ